ncbi:hypothetical protein CNMCM6805_006948 [Aspergillus fumigatiaffinis]|uniref:Uncharacterized protein n=1 Tax=Aspergillus fumigatiaffinis TaxID=340414 RepID=A0A8H4H6D8_9EURO|nr:hypothetical protein CNMCM6805_006948 [Aspergillus fumigatiaffinis]
MTAELTCEQARQIVDEIGQRNGIITDEDRAATPPAVIKALHRVRNQLGRIRHPWTPCDTPDVRRHVVFQLISSARSLHYNWANKQGKEPYFSMDVSADRMVIDTNDDGCLKSDIVQLSEGCSAFLPNARANNLYDAVLLYTFRIAREAHVQSGPFSFVLGPRSPGDRLGFTTPVNRDPASLPEGVRTRIILYPALPGGFNKLVHEFKDIANDGLVLLGPDDTCQPMCKKFIFVARLENFQTTRLTYEVQLRDGILEVTKTYPDLFTFSLPSFTERFLVYKPTTPSSSFEEMALLFPIDQDSRPVIRSRKAYHIVGPFAFPISGVGFSFIFCATVTTFEPVSDADIETSTLLQDCVINSFCAAVSFCQNYSMPYGWVQYIPKPSTVSPAWRKTVEGLIENLRGAAVFQSHKGVRKSLSSLRYLSPKHYGVDNEPLFGASDDEHYLSTKYSAYRDILKPLGLQEVSDHEVLERLKPILTKPLRVLLSSDSQKERISRILRLLLIWLKRDPSSTLATEIRNFPVIELSNGSFIRGNDLNSIKYKADLASAKDAVYFSTDTNGNDIPKCLGILTVSEEAVKDNDQNELFRLLGVRRACPELVMELISHHSHAISFARLAPTTDRNPIAESMYILCYVYHSCAKDDRLKPPCLMLFVEHSRLDGCYFPIPEICNLVDAVSATLNINVLKLPEPWGRGSEQEWGFLRELGVSSGGTVAFMKVVKDRLLSTMTLEDAKPHFFELYRWISERSFNDLGEFFDDQNTVYIPDSGDVAKLVYLDQCVWNGPSWLLTAYALVLHEEYASDWKIRCLFSDTLTVQDADWGTYMTELLHLQDVGVGLIEETRRIYEAIAEDISEKDVNSLRSQFKRYKMIYVPGAKQWYSPEQCIWTSSSIGGKMGISNVYPDMESFFVEELQVQRPSIRCYISRIQHLCKDKGNVTEVIEALRHINNLRPTESDLDCLELINFLPIKGPQEEFYWGSVASDFFIIDRDGWPMLFYGEVPTVQFRVAEVRELAPLLKSLGLENRFISVCAVRKTSVSEMPLQPSPQLTTDFRERSSGLSSTSKETYSRLHMEYLNGKLSIFVPREANERLICYATQLPESLITSLEIKHDAAHGIFATVLQVPVEIVDGILEIHGIPELSDLDPVSPVIIDDSESVYEDALEEVFVPRASIAWGGKDQLLASGQSELQLVLRSKDMALTEYRTLSDRHETTAKEHANGRKM